jgi:hypothetical protein
LGYIEDGDRLELIADMDKKHDAEKFYVFKDAANVSEAVVDNCAEADVAKADSIVDDLSTAENAMVTVTGLTVAEQAEKIATTIQKYYKSYDYLSAENKARLFNSRIDDNSYNLKLHAKVLKKLGIHMYGSEGFEDYQSIYGETMKMAEKQDSEYERGYDDKKWEKGRSR